MSDAVDSTLELARHLRELADGFDEAQLRSALSRSYYSVYHAARVLAKVKGSKKVGQGNIVEVMRGIDEDLGASIRELRDIRHKADYDERYVRDEFGSDVEFFRDEVRKMLDQGLLTYRKIVLEIERARGEQE